MLENINGNANKSIFFGSEPLHMSMFVERSCLVGRIAFALLICGLESILRCGLLVTVEFHPRERRSLGERALGRSAAVFDRSRDRPSVSPVTLFPRGRQADTAGRPLVRVHSFSAHYTPL
jgi:hypothetical protein